jgi:regulator of replication initiation timing
LLSKNGFFIDSIPSMAVDASIRLRRLIEEREEETIRVHSLVNKMRQFLMSTSPEFKQPAYDVSRIDNEFMDLRIENQRLKERIDFLERKNLNLQKENEDLASIVRKNESEHNLVKEQHDLLLSGLRLSIEELTQKARPMEEQRILVQSLRETISSLAEENDCLKAELQKKK